VCSMVITLGFGVEWISRVLGGEGNILDKEKL
jgi:hypothetical protein